MEKISNNFKMKKKSTEILKSHYFFQGISQYSYALDAPGRRHRDFSELAKQEAFRNASTVYPVQTPEDFYRLHAYFSKVWFS